MKIGFVFILLFTLNNSYKHINDLLDNIDSRYNIFDDLMQSFFQEGQMKGNLSPDQYDYFIKKIQEKFSQNIYSNKDVITTLNNNKIRIFGLKHKDTQIKNNINLNYILITGLHHPREIITVSMNIYIMIQLLRKKDNIQNNVVYLFVPMLNIDGYKKINQLYSLKQYKLMEIRKNQNNKYNRFCGQQKWGVDLARNYAYKFNYDDIGSSSNPCSEDYCGIKPFSEKETQAIRDIVLKYNKKLVLNINFHSYGNLWIYPNNYDKDILNLKIKDTKFYSFYEQFHRNAPFYKFNGIGNAYQTLNYVANGETSDWMVNDQNILAFSPEIGNQYNYSQTHFPQQQYIYKILKQFYPSVQYIFDQIQFIPKVELFIPQIDMFNYDIQSIPQMNIFKKDCYYIKIFNKGLYNKQINQIKIYIINQLGNELDLLQFKNSIFINQEKIQNNQIEIKDEKIFKCIIINHTFTLRNLELIYIQIKQKLYLNQIDKLQLDDIDCSLDYIYQIQEQVTKKEILYRYFNDFVLLYGMIIFLVILILVFYFFYSFLYYNRNNNLNQVQKSSKKEPKYFQYECQELKTNQ